MQVDEEAVIDDFDEKFIFHVNDKIVDCSDLHGKFVQLGLDAESCAFLRECRSDYEGWGITAMKTMLLRPLMVNVCGLSFTRSNGLLGIGRLFAIGSKNAATLLRISLGPQLAAFSESFQSAIRNAQPLILDIGASDGTTTERLLRGVAQVGAAGVELESLRPLVHCTEVSSSQLAVLAQRGYQTLLTDNINESKWSDGAFAGEKKR